ncbi:hypothetical protein BH10ACI2_BH10ACI2_13130 [soil metagenome]
MMRLVKLHEKAREAIRGFSKPVRLDIGELLIKLQLGINLGMPVSRPMPTIASGTHELRLKDTAGVYRVFYYLKSEHGILVFHAFTKKTQKTPQNEIETAKRRLESMLEENDENK